MNYMYRVDETISELNKHANGSVLFDFTEDFGSPLSYEGTYTTDVLKAQDDKDGDFVIFSRSTVGDRYAYSTGGKSMSGTPAAASSGSDSSVSDQVGNSVAGRGASDASDETGSGGNVLPFSAPSAESDSGEETVPAQEAAKEAAAEVFERTDEVTAAEAFERTDEDTAAETSEAGTEESDAEVCEDTAAEPAEEENSDSEDSDEAASETSQEASEDAPAADLIIE